ncbi:unnamed protein product [Moneuplotes crassus]|uniref:Uncharacterized protein n=1 Tax=Euplotes crassus TaxID=5936 RepID=A0AAD1XX61_EUPCR|nr:unnamed protein product [Moneuplotes crassus]
MSLRTLVKKKKTMIPPTLEFIVLRASIRNINKPQSKPKKIKTRYDDDEDDEEENTDKQLINLNYQAAFGEEEEEESEAESYQPTPKIKQKEKPQLNKSKRMLLSDLKSNTNYKNFKPFQSNLYEDVKIDENEEYPKEEVIDNSVKGYIEAGSDQSSDHFDPMQNIKVQKPPPAYRQQPRKFESITSNVVFEDKFKNGRKVPPRQGSFMEEEKIIRKKSSIDANKSGVLSGSISKLARIKENSKGIPRNGSMIYDESIDVTKKDGWLIRIQGSNANESLAFGVGESIIKPHKLDESGAVFTHRRNNDFKKRIRKVDVERQQMELKKINKMQGQGATLPESENNTKNAMEGISQNLSEIPNPNVKAPGFDYYEVISEGSEDHTDPNVARNLMKRRRSRTRDFVEGIKGTSYGNFVSDMENIDDDDNKIKPIGNLDSSKEVNYHKKSTSPFMIQRELPLKAKEKRDSQLYNYAQIQLPEKAMKKSPLNKSPLICSNFFSANDQLIEERLASAAGDRIQEASITQENNSRYGRSSGMRDVASISESGKIAGYSRRKMVLQRDMRRPKN